MSKKTERAAAIKAQEEARKSALEPKLSDGMKNLDVAGNCPVKFSFKGETYDVRTISKEKARALAEDEDFQYIQIQKRGKSSDNAEESGVK